MSADVSITIRADGAESTANGIRTIKRTLDDLGGSSSGVNQLTSCMSMLKQAVAGLIGIQLYPAIKEWAAGFITAGLAVEKYASQLKAITGSSQLARAELEFVRKEANRLGLDMNTVTQSFANFLGAAKGTAIEGSKARQIFTGLSEGLAAMKLPAEQTARAFIQFQQILSKGKLQSEDLITLSESLPIARQMFEQAAGGAEKLAESIKKGTAESIPLLEKAAAILHATYGVVAVEAADSAQGAINRFNNELTRMKEVAGKELLGPLASGLTAIRTHADEIKTVFIGLGIAIGAVAVGSVAQAFATWVGTMQVQLALMRMEMTATSAVSGVLTAALNILKVAWATNPVGLIATALAAAVGGWMLYTQKQKDALDAPIKGENQVLKNLREEVDLLKTRNELAAKGSNLKNAPDAVLTEIGRLSNMLLSTHKSPEEITEIKATISFLKKSVEDQQKQRAIEAARNNKRNQGGTPDDTVDVTDERYKKYSDAMDHLNNQIREHNPFMERQNVELLKVDDTINKLATDMPEYATSLREAGDNLKKNIGITNDYKAALADLKEGLHQSQIAQQKGREEDQSYADAVQRYKDYVSEIRATQEANDSTSLLKIKDPFENQMKAAEFAFNHRKNLLEDELKLVKDNAIEEGRIKAQLAANEAAYSNKTADIEKAALKSKLSMASTYTGQAGQLYTLLAETQDTSSRKGFESAKSYNVAAAVMNTAAGIMNAFATSGNIYSGIATAAMVAATGAVQISKILSTQFGGGSGSVSAPGGYTGGSNGGVGTGGADVNVKVGSMIGTPTQSVEETVTLKILAGTASSMERAALALTKISDGIMKVSDAFVAGSIITNLGGQLQSDKLNYRSGASEGWNAGWSGEKANWSSAVSGIIGSIGGIVGAAIGALGGKLGSAVFGSLYGGMFGGSWQTTEKGINLGGVGAQTISGYTYTKREKDGGWLGKDKKETTYGSMDSETVAILQDTWNSVLNTIVKGAEILNTSFMVDMVSLTSKNIETSGRSAADINAAIESWFTTNADIAAQQVVGLKAYTAAGESAFDALVRLANAYQIANEKFVMVGKTALSASVANADAAFDLITLMGGVDKFADKMDKYFEAMFNEGTLKASTAAAAAQAVNTSFDLMGLKVPKTKAEFSGLVNSMDVTTDRGQALYAQLINTSEAFSVMIEQQQVLKDMADGWAVRSLKAQGKDVDATFMELRIEQEQEYADAVGSGADLLALKTVQELEWANTVKEAMGIVTDAMSDLIDKSRETATGLIDAYIGIAQALNGMKTGPAAMLSPEAAYNQSKASYSSLLGKTDLDSLKALPQAAQAFLDASKSYNASGGGYQSDFASVTAYLQSVLPADGNLSVPDQISLLEQIKTAVEEGATDTVDKLGIMLNKKSDLAVALENLRTAIIEVQTAADIQEAVKTYNNAKSTIAPPLSTYLSDIQDVTKLKSAYDSYTKSPEYLDLQSKYDAAVTLKGNADGLDKSSWDMGSLSDLFVSKANDIANYALLAGLAPEFFPYKPEYDIAPKGKPDGVLDSGDAGLWLRIASGLLTYAEAVRNSYATGTASVPYDMLAQIHQGEIIMDRASSDILRKYGIPTRSAADNRGVEERLDKVVGKLEAVEGRLRSIETKARLVANA